ncbi:NAD-dependent succinate-semialdehyde dehydrogenase [Pseudomonas otitidis]|uniref:NAD-dependent succinate-semialdehyde dehydrogenase n=1 Tax=Metapseudomonas otitidis TaxID=319939 RepID=UPI002447AD7A|nr:NAD-dependent succinate-semialdehyde dehydrogenase [Pseudomonas otitidis]MDH1108402.1 NAD-dependent succinate-semialdehyde dehydrogenase [Pseudomonas otitidis]MDH1161070.1 NAD-dependent succinate-semialdehyde dehydrogenase [Pseudomonas otitidis]MDH1167237.1 NAD-dependent succinate-semialdehyde dehydrogenase [Pseudomonas otitidis]
MTLDDLNLLREQAYVNGQWIEADDDARFAVTNPANGELIAEVASLGRVETARAIDAAQAALPAWRARTAKERSTILRRWYELIMANQEDLARLLSWEQGKPLAESRGEIAYGASFIEWFAEEAKRVYGDVIPHDKPGRRLVVIKQAIGIVAAITPWNFPNAMITRKVGPALAAGCTVVLKPASETPLSALALAALGERAGIPAGVLNIVPGTRSREIGAELTGNPLVQKLSFTGSTGIGKLLMAQCAETIKKVSLELGGNAPFIVFDDADLDAAVQGALGSKFRNTGQTCVCTNRLLVQRGVYDEFARRLVAAVSALKVAPADDDGAQQGPLINAKAVAKVEEHIADAVAKGARVLAGGKPHALGGNFFEPTVLGEVTPEMLVARDETFGPLAPIFRFDTEEQAIAMANDTEFGLASYLYTRDLGRAWRVSEALEYGMVGVNEGLISTEVAPFGGIKQSGLGREGSRYGIDDYIEQKYMCLGIG